MNDYSAAAFSTTLVTVTYADRIIYLRELLTRAFEHEKVGRAIVISNGSTSDLRSLEDHWGARLKVVRLDMNTGSANGYAVGIHAALADGAKFLWLMDDDNAPKPGALRALHDRLNLQAAHLDPSCVAVVGFRPTHQADIAQGVDIRQAYPPRSSFLGFHYRQIFFKILRRLRPRPRKQAPASFVSLPYAPYGGLLAGRAVFERIGLPMRDLVLYADDTEYTRRVTKLGGKIELVTEAELEDLEGSWNLKSKYSNTFIGWLDGGSDFRAFYAARNHAWFDRHVWIDSRIEYFVNQAIYMALLKFFSLRARRSDRYSLLLEAIENGKRSKLGVSARHPLSARRA